MTALREAAVAEGLDGEKKACLSSWNRTTLWMMGKKDMREDGHEMRREHSSMR